VAESSSRIVAVDIMRGLTMAAMIVVNNPGTWAHMYDPLKHAPWGAVPTPADFVFPFFLFLMGVATPLSLKRRKLQADGLAPLLQRALRRAAVLFAIGLFLNLFPQFDPAGLRIPGVLQRIAVVSLGCAAAFLWLGSRGIAGLVAVLLVGYGLVLLLVPVPGAGGPVLTPEMNLPVWLDERLLGAHTWRGPGDPEGVLSTLGALATSLVGVLAGMALTGRWTGRELVPRFAGAGAAAVVLGAAAGLVLPVAKDVWTSSYALITGGMALLVLAGLHRWYEGRMPGRITGFWQLFGRQALLAYMLAHLFSDLSIHVLRFPRAGGESISLHSLVYRHLLSSWLPDRLASLVYSLVMLTVVWVVVRMLDRRGVRLRV